MGPQTAAALPVLAFGADRRAENECRKQAHQRVEELAECEGVHECHVRRPSRQWNGDESAPQARPMHIQKIWNRLATLRAGESKSCPYPMQKRSDAHKSRGAGRRAGQAGFAMNLFG
jgi:hypothetical protein